MLTKTLKRFFSFNVDNYNFYNKLYPPNHSRICIVGSDLPGIITSSVLPPLSTVESYYMRLFSQNNFISLDGAELLAISLKDKEELNIPVLKLVNECILIEFETPIQYFPETNTLKLFDKEFVYDNLVITSEPVPNLEHISGFKSACFDPYNSISSLFDLEVAEKTFRILENYRLGNIPKKIVFYTNGDLRQNYFSLLNLALLFEEKLRLFKKGFRELTEIIYITNGPNVCPGKELFDKYLTNLLQERNIKIMKKTELLSINNENSNVLFKDESGNKCDLKVGVLIAEPPYELPLHLKQSPFVNSSGKLNFNKNTLIHNEFPNVYCAGSHLHAFQNINLFFDQGITVSNNIMVNIVNQDKKNKYKHFEYKDCNHIIIYKSNKKITRLISDGEKDEIKEMGLKGYLWETYGQTEILKRFLHKGKWFGKNHFLAPEIEFHI